MASRGQLDAIAMIEMRRSCGPQSSGSSSTHVTIYKPSKSDDHEIIGHLATHGATRGFVRKLRSRLDMRRKKNASWDHGSL